MSSLRSAAIRLAHSKPGAVRDALLPVLQKTAAGGTWEKGGTKPMTVKAKSYDPIKGKGTLYTPKDLPKELAKIAAVVVFVPDGEMDKQAWWGGSGYFADAAKAAFGLKGRLAGPKFFHADMGSPIGNPDDEARKDSGASFIIPFTGG